jgi:hypothetical protein
MKKSYYIDLYYEYPPGTNYKVDPLVVMELTIDKSTFSARLLSYSFKTKTFTTYNEYLRSIEMIDSEFMKHDENMMMDYIEYLNLTINTEKKLESFIQRLENPELDIAKHILEKYSYNEVLKRLKRKNLLFCEVDFSIFLPQFICEFDQLEIN